MRAPSVLHRSSVIRKVRNEALPHSAIADVGFSAGFPRHAAMTKGETVSQSAIADVVAEAAILQRRSCHEDLIDSTEMRENGKSSGIEKGVILNVNYVSNETYSYEMNPPHTKSANGTTDEKLAMSWMRKLVFALSFLPSVMFVLCFAVILPCEQISEKSPYTQEIWSLTLNNTVLTTRPNLLEDLLFTYSEESVSRIASLSFRSGGILWNSTLKSGAVFMDCGNLDWDGSGNCLVVDDSSHIYIFNASDGEVKFLDFSMDKVSTPIILPHCKGTNESAIAFTLARSFSDQEPFLLRVISKAEKYDVMIPPCTSMPSNLLTWTRNETTDLLYYCDRNLDGDIMKIPQGKWCGHTLNSDNVSRFIRMENLKQHLALPTMDGLLIWNEKEVIMTDNEGKESWKFSSGNHSTRGRFLKFGKFCGDENEVALFSSENFTSQITTLNAVRGNETWTTTIPDASISDVHHLTGKNKDYALLFIQTMKSNFAPEASVEDSSNDMEAEPTKNLTGIQRIALAELGSKYSIHILQDKEIARESFNRFDQSLESSSYRGDILSVNVDEKHLKIVTVSSIGSTPGNQQTLLRGITVKNWDISTPGSRCTLSK